MTLLPEDIISTLTPAGMGFGQKPLPVYLKAGDIVELGIDGLGSSKQTCVSYNQKNQNYNLFPISKSHAIFNMLRV